MLCREPVETLGPFTPSSASAFESPPLFEAPSAPSPARTDFLSGWSSASIPANFGASDSALQFSIIAFEGGHAQDDIKVNRELAEL